MSDTDNRDSRAILAAASHEVAAKQIKAKHDIMLKRRDGATEDGEGGNDLSKAGHESFSSK